VQIGYYDQRSADLRDNMRLIEFIENEAAVIRTKEGERVEAAQMLEWFLFPAPDAVRRIGSLSGGERRRLYLLRTLVHQPNVLLLDEPTNDLDIQTLAVLEEFLDHFTGCLVVASHDRYFLDRTVDFLVTLADGRLGPRYPGPFSTFVRLQEEAATPLVKAASATASAPPAKPGRARSERRLTWKEQQELNDLEVRIEGLETRRFLLLDEIQKSGDNYVGLRILSDELNKIEQEVDAAMERWLELSSLTEPTGR
jgi:ATP-binding cassette subfamily F protein uup